MMHINFIRTRCGDGSCQGTGRHGRDAGEWLESTAAFHKAATLHDPQVGLRLVQVLLEAGEQPIVLEQRVVTAHVGVKLVVGLLEDLPNTGAAVFQLLSWERRAGDLEAVPPSTPGPKEKPGGFIRENEEAFSRV